MPTTLLGVAARTVDLVKQYGHGPAAVRALDGVSLEVAAGRFTAIMGPSGSGKSTLLHCLAGLEVPTSGRVFLGEVELSALPERRRTLLRRERVGVVFQAFNLLPTLTAAENLRLPLAIAGRRPDPAWLERVVAVLGLGGRLGHRPAQLSGGEQQRVAAARALLARPELLLADEPTGNLDSRRGADLLDLLRRAVDDLGQTVVTVTHDPVVASQADLTVFLADGRVVDQVAASSAAVVLDRLKTLGAEPLGG
jgi:putative ABC transport system ATP-binding protein